MYKLLIFLNLFFLISACVSKIPQTQMQDDRQKVAIGISFSQKVLHFNLNSNRKFNGGLKINFVLPYSTAAKANLKSGDIIVGFNEDYFYNLDENFVEKFTSHLKQLKIGEKIAFKVIRNKDFLENKSTNASEVVLILEGRRWNYGDLAIDTSNILPQLRQEDQFQSQIEKNLNSEIKKDEADLLNRFEDLASLRDSRRLPLISFLQNNPFKIHKTQSEMLKILQDCKSSKQIWKCLKKLTAFSGLDIDNEKSRQFTQFNSTKQALQIVHKTYLKSEKFFKKAFEKISDQEFLFLKTSASRIATKFENGEDFFEETSEDLKNDNFKFLELLQKIEIKYLVQSILVYAEIADTEFLTRLKNIVTKSQAEKTIVDELKTQDGVFIIGGTDNNNYINYANDEVKMIIDLGGDDYYPDISANIIDLSGNDTYESSKAWTLNSGFFRTRILYDLSGDDKYISAKGGIASSFCGASLLIDSEGNDKYFSQTYSQGVSWTGFSALIDLSGNDNYQSTMLSQAVGIAGGFGFLLDFSGNDEYFSKGFQPSSYQDAGQFNGLSQGVGVGIRNFVSGGWGLLYDGSGKDHFEAGTFSQGGGYYFALGSLINDGNEDDYYSGGRYCQGFAAHSAIGNFLDVGGNDTYFSPSVVGLGIAWDLSIALFQDLQGNDVYYHPGHFIGSASHNSFAFFIDEQGEDTYMGDGLPYELKVNDYHGGKSLGIFWDKGSGVDHYKKIKNNSVLVIPGWQVLIDE